MWRVDPKSIVILWYGPLSNHIIIAIRNARLIAKSNTWNPNRIRWSYHFYRLDFVFSFSFAHMLRICRKIFWLLEKQTSPENKKPESVWTLLQHRIFYRQQQTLWFLISSKSDTSLLLAMSAWRVERSAFKAGVWLEWFKLNRSSSSENPQNSNC